MRTALVLFLTLLFGSSFVCASEPLKVGDLRNYFKGQRYEFGGAAPYLTYRKSNIDVKVFYGGEDKDAKDALNIEKFVGRQVKQVNMMTKVCNKHEEKIDGSSINPKNLPKLSKQIQELNVVVQAFTDSFVEGVPSSFFEYSDESKQFETTDVKLKYEYHTAEYCDTNGGGWARYKIYMRANPETAN